MGAEELLHLVQLDAASGVAPTAYLGLAVALAITPLAVGLLTSFVKVSVVIGIVKNALGTQHAPNALVSTALSLAITGISMMPVLKECVSAFQASSPDLQSMSPPAIIEALKPSIAPLRAFIERNTGTKELRALSRTTVSDAPQILPKDAELLALVPAFLLTELKEGFTMACVVLLPFLAIDLIIANLLMGLGMMMVSPVLLSLPLKLIFFVVSDAWLLIAQGLLRSYQV